VIPEKCPRCRLYWRRGEGVRDRFGVIGIYDRTQDSVTAIKCPRCSAEFVRGEGDLAKKRAYDEAWKETQLFAGRVIERTPGGDVPFPASPHHICSISGLVRAPLAQAARIVSILDPGTRAPVELREFEEKTLHLEFDDVIAPMMSTDVLPDALHVEAILDFDRGARPDDRLVVHCHAGISRSTASFVIMLAQRRPNTEASIFAELRSIRARSWRNARIIMLADDVLGTGGSLTRELREHRKIIAEQFPELAHLARLAGAI
jgi:predicted protein tyrosine phosphatase